ncbi:putative Acyl-CoA N-acyltransferase [Vibrio nigripulchritudo MADA3029]|uniref:GNAT family N-acetyltransferase n=1 Tax=Vibrio nigripulchritudo TaxID=28173 RepID=UPI0003B1CB09|nr:GNAT family N-acetyltransferase [Vibrio nigripulchritudo]CCN47275.1 putative Acyl-CoA N-acyltransferase [Vibrio nigripulchritudo MADA3020]CCN55649.1 putative Acyl-CoA N-acyltransferase [Vibrio nigripulchritudo MADA3021]CCN61508.1 putative Acyl-CoA N-acyltransferase [Vibrio nigripulchritudo MADA3029]BDU35682.1 acyltransferase [Vibrio nigripulchritudo]BDU41352.1 acyltransferase [Vibrio nigripulchritudo]
MSELEVKILDPIQLPLVKRLYKQHYSSAKPKSDELTLVGYLSGNMIAAVRFRTIEDFRLLTGMVIATEHRKKGFGSMLMEHCRNNVLEPSDYCFAYEHLENFYQSHGFVTVSTEALPGSLKSLFTRYSNSGKKLKAMKYNV